MDSRPMATWHFFRRETETELWCAVPAHRALPAFLLSGEWHFSGHQSDRQVPPPGFDRAAAAVAERFNGFYLFQLTAMPRTSPILVFDKSNPSARAAW